MATYVYVVEIRDSQLIAGGYPVAVCASEDLHLDEVRRMLEGIGRMAKLKRDLEGAPGDAAGDALGRVLDTLATELGVSL